VLVLGRVLLQGCQCWADREDAAAAAAAYIIWLSSPQLLQRRLAPQPLMQTSQHLFT
jgi:hypothetical protein